MARWDRILGNGGGTKRRAGIVVALLAAVSLSVAVFAWATTAAQTLPYAQNWSNAGLVTANNNWDGVPGVVGYGGAYTGAPTGVEPQDVTIDLSTPVNAIANQTNPNTLAAGGVAEFGLADPVVALQADATADAPHLILNLNTTGQTSVNVAYNILDVDGSADNAVQKVGLQYRASATGNFTHVSTVADATTGPNLANKVTSVSATLPAAANNKALVQVRVVTTNANGTAGTDVPDEWVGIDDISVTSGTNKAPVNAVPAAAQSTNEDAARVFNTANGNRISVSDADAGTSPVRVTLEGTNGALTLSRTTGLTFSAGDGASDAAMTFTGTITNVNLALDGLSFAPAPNFNGTAGLRIITSDQCTTCSGGAKSDTDPINVAVTPVNDAPTAALNGPATVDEGDAARAYDFTVADPDAGDTFTIKTGFPDCGAGGSLVSGSLSTTASGGAFRCRFPDGPASPTARVQIADAAGANSNVATRAVTVGNAAPVVDLAGPATADEGTTQAYSYAVTDPGDDPNPATTESCGTGGEKIETPEPNNFRCRFPDGPKTTDVSATADDRDPANNTATDTVSVEVANVAPSVALDGPATANEGQTGAFDFAVTDPGGDAFAFADGFPDCGTGGEREGTPSTTATGGGFRCAFPDGPAEPGVRVRVSDSDGDAGNTAARRVVVNGPPDAADDAATADEDASVALDVLANDTDPDGDPRTLVSNSGASDGAVECGGSGRCTYTPNADFNGDDSFTYTTGDGKGLTDTGTVDVTVTAVNDAPSFVEGGDLTVAEDAGAQTIPNWATGISPGPEDESGQGVSFEVSSDGGALFSDGPSVSPDGALTFTPAANANGAATVTALVRDGGGVARGGDDRGNEETFAITVSAVNDRPSADDDDARTDEDEAVVVDVLEGDEPGPADESGQPLRVTEVSGPDRGTAQVIASGPDAGKVRYAPNENYNGPDSFEYEVCDGGEPRGCDEAEVSVAVAPANDAPVASDDAYDATEDETLAVGAPGVLGNDADVDGDPLSVEVVSGPDGGTLDLNADGSFDYRPGRDFDGADGFTYKTTDGAAESESARVDISVSPTNDAPVAANDAAATDEDAPVNIPVLGNDSDIEGDRLGILTFDQGRNGTVTRNEDGTLAYTPNRDSNGRDAFTYTIEDGNGGEGAATVTVEVAPVNDRPVAADDPATTDEDGELIFDPAANDSPGPGDEGSQELEVRSVSPAAHGSAQVIEGGDNAGKVRYIPAENYNGPDSFEYEVCDGGEPRGCDTATVEVTVTAVNDAPVAEDDSATTPEEAAVEVSVKANDRDVEDDALSLAGVSDPDGGTAVISGDAVSYEPDRDFNGTDTFEYTVEDGNGGESSATVAVAVAPRNDAPTISDVADETIDEDTSTGPISFTVRDVDDAAHELRVSGGSDDGALVPDENVVVAGGEGERRTVEVTPVRDRHGEAVISLTVRDGTGPDSLDAGDSFLLTVRDKTPPAAPRLDLEAASDTGASDADDVTRDDTPAFVGDAEPGSRVAVFDGNTRLGDVAATDAEGAWRFAAPILAEGERRISARSTDAAGNTSTASAPLAVTLDTTAPDTDTGSSPSSPTNATRAAFEFSSTEDGSSFGCGLDGGGFAPCASPEAYEGLSDGEHAFEVRATDRAGNTDGSPSRRAWTVDTRNPGVALMRPADGDLVRGQVMLEAAASDDLDVGAVRFLVDGTVVDTDMDAPPYVFEWDSTDVPDGEHVLEAGATDAAGNEATSAARTVRVDNTAPKTIIDSSPNNPTSSATVAFEFSSTEDGSSFGCKLDGGGFAPCSSPEAYEGLDDGEHHFMVRAVDAAGNEDPTPAERAVVIDTQAPGAPIIERPREGARDNDGAFAVSGTAEPGSSVRLFEDGEPVGGARTDDDGRWSVALSGVTDGDHAYSAQATDAAGNESRPSAGRAVLVDARPPTVSAVLPDEDEAAVPVNTTVQATFSKEIDGATLDDDNFTLSRGGEAVPSRVGYDVATGTATLDPDADLAYSTSYTATLRGRAGGVEDLSGNPLAADESWSFTTAEEPDNVAPDAPAVGSPAEGARVNDGGNFAVSGTAEPDSQVRLFEGSRGVGTDRAGPEGRWSIELSGVGEGRHVYAATATDTAGNVSEPSAGRVVFVDLTPPDTVIGGDQASPTASRTAVFGFSSGEGGSGFECSLDDGPFGPCGSPKEYSGLGGGKHVFEVRAVDGAGNVDPSPARRSWTVDVRAPEVRITAPGDGTLVRGEARLEAAASDDLGVKKVQFLVDGVVVNADSSAPYDFGWDSTGIPDGEHVLEARAVDVAGNETTSARRAMRVDNAAPDTSIDVSPSSPGGAKARFEFSSTEAGSTFECRIDGGEFVPCVSPREYDGLADGQHAFEVRATDRAGNVDTSPASRAWTVAVAPAPGACTRTGTPGNDVMTGTAGNDVICGLGGNDTIKGGAGDDQIKGGDGKDKLYGEAGADKLFGEIGVDLLHTKDKVAGNDSADGGVGKDKCTIDKGDKKIACP